MEVKSTVIDKLDSEAALFTHYLIGQEPSNDAVKLYKRIIEDNVLKVDKADQKLLAFVIKYRFCLGLVDAGLVFHKPQSEIRRRLYIMLAVLEASPAYCDKFLPKKYGPFELFGILFSGVRSVVKIALGSVLVRIVI